jgi:hypothetical protein
MSNVRKLPNVPKTPRELLDEHADKIDTASSIAIVIRSEDGTITTNWSNQPRSQLLYSVRALCHDVETECFAGDNT